MKRGLLIVVSGPSGAGKGTIIRKLLPQLPDARLSISCTTRGMRPGERDGVDYFFISAERFEEMVQNGEFLEYANVFGMNRYGTPRPYVEQTLEEGKDLFLEIDVEGGRNVKKAMPEALLVFLQPPDTAELERRLRGRATETEAQIEKRLATARDELMCTSYYDYVVVNDDIDRCTQEILRIILEEKERRSVEQS